MRTEDLEAVLRRHVQGVAHGVVDDFADGREIGVGFSFEQIDPYQGHVRFLCHPDAVPFRPCVRLGQTAV
jgi:hypothetical protein